MKTLRIAAEIGQSLFSDPDNYNTFKSTGRPTMVTPRDKRRIIKAASNSIISFAQITSSFNLACTPQTIHRVLNKSSVIVREKMIQCPKLTEQHKVIRLAFAEEK